MAVSPVAQAYGGDHRTSWGTPRQAWEVVFAAGREAEARSAGALAVRWMVTRLSFCCTFVYL